MKILSILMQYCSAMFLLLSFGTFSKVEKFYRKRHQRGILTQSAKKIFLAGNFFGGYFWVTLSRDKKSLENSSKKLIGHALEKCLILAYNKRIIKVRSVN